MRSTEFDDPRVTFLWDPMRITGFEWKETLGMDQGLAWDIYFVYGKNASWGDIPAEPDYWMHQLGFPPEVAPRLDGDLLSANLSRMMREKNSGP